MPKIVGRASEPRPRMIVATTFVEAREYARKRRWRTGEWGYVYSYESLFGMGRLCQRPFEVYFTDTASARADCGELKAALVALGFDRRSVRAA